MSEQNSSFTGDGIDDYAWLMREVIRWESDQAEDLGKILIDMFNPRSVIDLGCATGSYLIPFRNNGVEILGIDGCEIGGSYIDDDKNLVKVLEDNEFERVDLRLPYVSKRRYDLGLCIEVAEHIPEGCSCTLVDTCIACADTILFCAAPPGQYGHHHMNCRPKQDWINMFANRRYIKHERNQELMDRIEADIRMEPDRWLSRNTQLFRKM